MINCYDLTKSTLALFCMASYKVGQLDVRIDELAEALIDIQFRRFCRTSGLDDMNSEDRESVLKAAEILDDFLPAATMESSVLLHPLSSPRLAASITLRASKMFADRFKQVKEELQNLYEDCNEIFPRSFDEVVVLLALD